MPTKNKSFASAKPPQGFATVNGVRAMGTVRRSQSITTYGIGAIVDLTDGSVMPMGLEEWEANARGGRLTPVIIHEPRLQAQLGVDFFRLAPATEELDAREQLIDRRYSIPCVRFPAWQECPQCHRLGTHGDPFEVADDSHRLVCKPCGKRAYVNPVRFIAACERGHIRDFPWIWWAHRHEEHVSCANPALFLRSRHQSAALSDLYIFCKMCGASSSMGNAFSIESLAKLGCNGERPWLGDAERDCNQRLRALQRGASNVHFPVIATALSIPPASEPYFQFLDDAWPYIRSVPVSAIDPALAGMAAQFGIEFEPLKQAYEARRRMEAGEAARSDLASRVEEYNALSSSREDESVAGRPPEFCNESSPAPDAISPWFDLIGAVSRLREVRALTGFSRLEPYPVSGERIRDALTDGSISPLSKAVSNWFPAAEIRGEGIFLRFRTTAIDEWIAKNPDLLTRSQILEERSAAVANKRGYQREYRITPRLLLVHSFAHAMIRQLSLDCGYSSSALRERLYVSDEGDSAMNGLLIYTGSPDSEGSLGGLVRLAQPRLIVDAVIRAVRHARWCGSDPVCAETDPNQSGDRISGAACHCCLLVPETACEKFNRELDRTFLIGDGQGRWAGFFNGLGEDEVI